MIGASGAFELEICLVPFVALGAMNSAMSRTCIVMSDMWNPI